jgi:prepilin-type N-terminal cleavage/methylation domain-containing protein
MSRQQLKEKGFTIIEVVLVLAIAALIFLMVFIALPALQSSQRDTARKNDVSIVSAAVNSWSGNNRGAELTELTDTALREYARDLSDNTDTVTVVTDGSLPTTTTDGTVTVVMGATCDTVGTEGAVTLATGTVRQYATITRLEGGNGSGYCLAS